MEGSSKDGYSSIKEESFMCKKILLVDDDEGLRTLYKEDLEEEGFEVLTANNGKEAMDKLEKKRPDLIILDIVMPKMDGMETLGRILKKDRTVPVILHTSHPGYQEDFFSWAADAFVIKSADIKELKGKIRELLEKGGPESEATRPRKDAARESQIPDKKMR
jgi:two-component system response regulator (stage 0 sporulation protein F)